MSGIFQRMDEQSYDAIFRFVHYAQGLIGIPLNVVLMILIFRVKSRSLGTYRVLLFNSALTDLIHVTALTALQPRLVRRI